MLNGHRLLDAPLIAGVNAPPDDDAKMLRRAAVIKQRPEIMDGVRFILDLQRHEKRPQPPGPDDIARRELALKRASALAQRMPVWPPPPPVPFKPQLDGSFDPEVWSDNRVKNHGGRKPLFGDRAMTPAERSRRYRKLDCGAHRAA